MHNYSDNFYTKKYCDLNVFNPGMKEIFEMIKHSTPRLLKQYLGVVKTANLEGLYYLEYNALMEAVSLGEMEMIKFICEFVKNKYTRNNRVSDTYISFLNQINIEGKTALIIAALTSDTPEIMQYLIKEGAITNIKDRDGYDIFSYSHLSSSESVEDYINSLKK